MIMYGKNEYMYKNATLMITSIGYGGECYKVIEIYFEEKYYVNKFIENINTEIRSPLNGIMGMISLVQDTRMTPEQMNYIDMLKECSVSLLSITNNVMDYIRVESQSIQAVYTDTSIRKCVANVSDMVMSNVHVKNLQYKYSIGNIPDLVYTDPFKLQQIILNLVSNSVKYTFNGYINVNVYSIDKTIQFDIIDTGCGIDERFHDTLFIPPYNAATETKTGAGIGLIISKGLVEVLGGTIWLNWSRQGKGSMFSFNIPCASMSEYNIQVVCHSLLDKKMVTTFLGKLGLVEQPGKKTLVFVEQGITHDSLSASIVVPIAKPFTLERIKQALCNVTQTRV
jgi:K+-sensing histidine kinase KdpD